MAEKRRRGQEYTIESSIEELLAETSSSEPVFGRRGGFTPFVLEHENVVTGEKKEKPLVEEPLEDVYDEEAFEEVELPGMVVSETEEDDDDEIIIPESARKKKVVLPQTLYSGGGKHLKPSEKKSTGETVEKLKEAGTGAWGTVKTFFKESVVPLFMETQPEEELAETPVVSEEAENPEEVVYENGDDEQFSFREMYDSAKAGIGSFVNGAANFVNTKIINPIMDKIKYEDEEEVFGETGRSEEEKRSNFRVVQIKRPTARYEPEDDFEELSDEGEFFTEEEEEERPGLLQRLCDRIINGDDYDEDWDYEEDDEEPGFFESLKILNPLKKRPGNGEAEDAEYESAEPEAKPKSSLAETIRKFFSDDEEDFDEDFIEGEAVVLEEDYLDEEDDSEEDIPFRVIPDPKIFDEIVAEKEAARKAETTSDTNK